MAYRNILSKWDPEKSSWRTFCSTAIRNNMLKLLAKEVLYKQRHQIMGNWNGDLFEEIPDALDVEELVLEKEKIDCLHDALQKASQDLSELELRILWHRLASYDPVAQTTIAEIEGVSQQAVSKAEERVLNKIKEVVEYEI
jgi:RNA polymerase sigma factor (sigma-70 family)